MPSIVIQKNEDLHTYEVYCYDHEEWQGGYETLKEAREAKLAPSSFCLGCANNS